jgi:TIR domain
MRRNAVADVFISYSKREPQYTIDLARDLEARGYTTWWDTSLLPGDKFAQKIGEELSKAKVVIVIWSRSSVESSWVQAEAYLADEQNKLVTLKSPDLDARLIPLPYNIRHASLVTDRNAIYAALNQKDGLVRYGDGISAEIIGWQQTLDDTIGSAKNIIDNVFGIEKKYPLFDIIAISATHHIDWNGDTNVNSIWEVQSNKEPAHFFKYWINADDESHAVPFLRQLNLEVVDIDNSIKLDFILTRSDIKHKTFAIFFPEIKVGDRKKFRISYFWPGYMNKLRDLGAAKFDWSYRSQHAETLVKLRKEWIFDPRFKTVHCREAGQQSKSASLQFREHKNRSIWIYEDPLAILDGTACAVEFALVHDSFA